MAGGRRSSKRYHGSIERRGNSFRVRLCVNGKRFSFTVATKDREVARQVAAKRYEELREAAARRALGKTEGAITFSALLARYEQLELPNLAPGGQRSYRNSFPPFRAFFVEQQADPLLGNIRPADIAAFLSWRRSARRSSLSNKGADPRSTSRNVSAHTIAKDRRVLHRLFEFACALELIEHNPARRVSAPKGDPRTPHILNEQEYERLLAACAKNTLLKLYIAMLAETGARAYSEALHLRWSDVDLQGGFILIRSAAGHRTKSGKSRWAPITPRLSSLLHEAPRTSEWVFAHLRSKGGHKRGERIKEFRTAFRTACKRAGLPEGFRQHDLRHRRVTTWLAEGKPAVLVREAVGHADLATTMAYTHLAREHLRVLID